MSIRLFPEQDIYHVNNSIDDLFLVFSTVLSALLYSIILYIYIYVHLYLHTVVIIILSMSLCFCNKNQENRLKKYICIVLKRITKIILLYFSSKCYFFFHDKNSEKNSWLLSVIYISLFDICVVFIFPTRTFGHYTAILHID